MDDKLNATDVIALGSLPASRVLAIAETLEHLENLKEKRRRHDRTIRGRLFRWFAGPHLASRDTQDR